MFSLLTFILLAYCNKTVWGLLWFFIYIIFIFEGILDLLMNFPGYHRWKFSDILRNILKILVSLAWVIILPLCYMQSVSFTIPEIKEVTKWLRQVKGVPQLYLMAVALYLLPNVLAALLFLFPLFRRWIENSDWHLIRFLLWWSQVSFLYVLFCLIIIMCLAKHLRKICLLFIIFLRTSLGSPI